MSQHCQFCDKEIFLTESIVYIKEYITCGRLPCIKKAKDNDRYYAAEKKEAAKTLVSLIVFHTKTPEQYNTWVPIKPDKHPEFLKDQNVLYRLLLGDVINLKDCEDCYRALPTEDVKRSDFPHAVQLLLDDMGITEKPNDTIVDHSNVVGINHKKVIH
ncbi:MAG: hypothetical protein COA78_12120 [Blastopirellula sp.]|nr:MAG: hypothetical protein COA78_12120 [Blastopirellula sp.]